MTHHGPFRIGIRAHRLGQRIGEQVLEQWRPHLGSTPVALIPIDAADRATSNRGGWPGSPLERALAKGEIDVAIQNAKDLAPDSEPGVAIAAVTERFTPFDVLIARDESIFDDLPDGAAISAHSPLRRAMLLNYRRDLNIVDFAGSLDERIRMLDSGEVDGLIVSASAVEHLGYQDRVTEIFTTEVLVPAAGQGACAIQVRQASKDLLKLAKHLDHRMARSVLAAERAFLRALKAGPSMPVGALATSEGTSLRLEGVVSDRDGRKLFRDVEVGKFGDEEGIGERLAKRLLDDGAKRLLAIVESP
jgi:hydroxymethylbilane synthase